MTSHNFSQLFTNKTYTPKLRVPKMGGPVNHPFLDGIFHYKPTILGIPHLWKPPIVLWMVFD